MVDATANEGAVRTMVGVPRASAGRSAEAASQIKEYILVNRLHPGDPLPTEIELGALLSVSRSSVREAVRTLSTLGIVEVRHGHGTFVGEMSLAGLVETLVFRGVLHPGDDLRALREIIEIRQALDVAMADRVTEVVAGTHDPRLWELVGSMADAGGQGETFAQQDRDFHTTLLAKTDNSIIGPLVGAFWDVHTAVMPKLGVSLPDDLKVTADAHGEMLRTAEAGDSAGYQDAVRLHYEPLLRALDRTSRP